MADKGFDIQDLSVSGGLLLNIPPFKGSAPLGITDVQKTQIIAQVHIHVKTVIGKVKPLPDIAGCYTISYCWNYQPNLDCMLQHIEKLSRTYYW